MFTFSELRTVIRVQKLLLKSESALFAQLATVIDSRNCSVIPFDIVVDAMVVPVMGRNVQRDVDNNLLGHIWLELLRSSSEKLGRHRHPIASTTTQLPVQRLARH